MPAITAKEREKIISAVDALMPELSKIHREIHTHPELAYQEHRASGLLADFLGREGFALKRGLAKLETSFRADSGDKAAKPRAAILCEYDALPGLGHGCGHSIIAAAGVGAGAALRRAFPKVPVTVMGSPAEESGGGKIDLAAGGAFRGTDFAIMVHPASIRQVVRLFLGVASRVFTFTGRPAHAAAQPESGVNALDAAVLFYTGVSALRQQLEDQVKVHMIITEGGKAVNIIPDRAQLICGIRALDLDVLADAASKIEAIATGAAKATGTKIEIVRVERLLLPLRVNHALSAVYAENARALGLALHPPEHIDRNIGSSDIGNLSHLMPAIHPHVPVCKPHEAAIHSVEFERFAGSAAGKKAVREGAILLALTALCVFKDKKTWKRIEEEFKKGKVKIPKGLV